MPAEGTVEPGAAVTNKFKLEIQGVQDTYWTRMGELTSELVTAEMDDGTVQTTGRLKPGESDGDQYMHHASERLALEVLYRACQTGAPGHKRPATLTFLGADGQPVMGMLILGFLLKGRKTPELASGSDGEGVKITWMFSHDRLVIL